MTSKSSKDLAIRKQSSTSKKSSSFKEIIPSILKTVRIGKADTISIDHLFQRAFSPKCPNCNEGRMCELVYSHEVHQEMYWCPKCGTLNIEVDAKPTWLTPTLLKEEK